MKIAEIIIKIKDIIKDTPYSELRFNIVLNHKTSPSGHKIRFQKKESITTVDNSDTAPAGIAILNNLIIKITMTY